MRYTLLKFKLVSATRTQRNKRNLLSKRSYPRRSISESYNVLVNEKNRRFELGIGMAAKRACSSTSEIVNLLEFSLMAVFVTSKFAN